MVAVFGLFTQTMRLLYLLKDWKEIMLQKIICQYKPQDIVGIDEMYYMGQERLYGINDNWSKSNWATRIFLKIRLQQIKESPF